MPECDEKDNPEPEQDEDSEGIVLFDSAGNIVEIRNDSSPAEIIFTPDWDTENNEDMEYTIIPQLSQYSIPLCYDDLEEREINGMLAIEHGLEYNPEEDSEETQE